MVLITKDEIKKMDTTEKTDNPEFDDNQVLYDNFDHGKYYGKLSTVPVKTDSYSKWIGGSLFFTSYMNNQYVRVQKKINKDQTNLKKHLVFAAKNSDSIVKQIYGVCDSLLVALLNGRSFQCRFLHILSSRSCARTSITFIQLFNSKCCLSCKVTR